ncbi:hypothetical protein FRB91_005880 [Serendipita sp. 411]|nr:hypothetical protein FRC15_011852 [Serendipita sp. 397]KAG8801696.1 hypothetical protein FRC16_011332 [Serendipita sp. 398]KAG8825154.1 hypothetical protein FRC19_000350 [Serendipita sp. 401]KAG8852844.1 hypothetical protein FRB91_005880 [Serendipita sp. 411]KAG8870145.1 hypothetical protein FRC20_000319 [Serendipita sp. 405]KAG9054664.1 hypothetical protein FS842_004511 [Serendipita sp. 407]
MAIEQQYVDRNQAMASYRPKGYGISPGLRRARRPFLFSNIVYGAVISLFVFGTWAYSIRAVSQDAFDDVDQEARALTAEVKKGVETVEERARKVEEKLKAIASERIARSTGVVPTRTSSEPPRGMLPLLARRYPGWYDSSQTLVWGAPPVDNMGRISDRSSP